MHYVSQLYSYNYQEDILLIILLCNVNVLAIVCFILLSCAAATVKTVGKSQEKLVHHSVGQTVEDLSYNEGTSLKPETLNPEENDLKFDVNELEVLPERPLQLVKPDPTGHKQLVLVEENIRHLHYVKGAVAVVAVVGKFHSGKSFLLNQLMGKHDGFGVGPTVKPQTMGIWMWGKVRVCTCKICLLSATHNS